MAGGDIESRLGEGQRSFLGHVVADPSEVPMLMPILLCVGSAVLRITMLT
jgi:hypothetical protein